MRVRPGWHTLSALLWGWLITTLIANPTGDWDLGTGTDCNCGCGQENRGKKEGQARKRENRMGAAVGMGTADDERGGRDEDPIGGEWWRGVGWSEREGEGESE